MDGIFNIVVLGLPFGIALAGMGCGIVTRKVGRSAVPVCAHCGYDLKGLHESRCPECGGRERQYRFTISHHIEWPRAIFSIVMFPMVLVPGVVACLVWAWFVAQAGFTWRTAWVLATKASDQAPIQTLWFACYVQSQAFLVLYLISILRYRRGWQFATKTLGVAVSGLMGMSVMLALAWFGNHTAKWTNLSIVAIMSPPAWGAAIGMLVGYFVLRRWLREPAAQPAFTPTPAPSPR